MPEQKMATIGDYMRSGERGDFARELAKAHDVLAASKNGLWELMEAYGRADEHNQARIEAALPGVRQVLKFLYNYSPSRAARSLREVFPILARLEEPPGEGETPHSIPV